MQGMGSSRRGRGARRCVVLAALAATAMLALPTVASANVPFQRITSPGPISDIYLGNELSCQVKLTQDEVFSYYPPAVAPGDCGTFLQINGVSANVYSPDFDAHDGTAANNAAWVPWTPVSQTPVGGSGTQGDPYTVTTTTAAGATGFQVQERYEYVTGSRGYNVFITVINNSPTTRTVDLYHAVDCYLAGSDFGYGFFDAAHRWDLLHGDPEQLAARPPARVHARLDGDPHRVVLQHRVGPDGRRGVSEHRRSPTSTRTTESACISR